MLNPAFSKNICERVKNDYFLPEDIVSLIKEQNILFNTGPELRTQKVYGDELWLKLKSLGLDKFDWSNKNVLDVCSGTGFLSFHLLWRIKPKTLTLLDISRSEIEEAKNLLKKLAEISIKYIVADATKTNLPNNSFDVIIGNSFLHHFYDVPKAILEFKRLLRPGGVFIALHEPTVTALAMETRNPKTLILYFSKGESYLDDFRYKGEGIAPNQGADVWLFRKKELVELFKQAGFNGIKISHWHFLRAKIVTTFGLHLNKKKPQLNSFERFLFQMGIYSDLILRKILPIKLFSSLALKAEKV